MEILQLDKKITGFVLDKETAINKKQTDPTFKVSRDLARQQTKPKPLEGDLFAVLSENNRETALELQSKGALLSDIRVGLDFTRSTLQSKVVLALAQMLAEQSEDKTNTGAALVHFEGTSKAVSFGETDKDGNPKQTPIGVVYLELSEFTKLVNGGVSYRDGGNKPKEIQDTINELCKKQFFYQNEKYEVWLPIMHNEGTFHPKGTDKTYMAIKLCPVFTKAISNGFITLRKDTLVKLKGRQKAMTISLFWLLADITSHLPLATGNTWKITKRTLLDEIATLPSYKNQSKRVEKDLREALAKMEELGLIESGGYTEDRTSLDTMSVFRLNMDYKKKQPSQIPTSVG